MIAMLYPGTSRFQAVLLSLCCISTTLTALPHMELGSPPAALPPQPRVTQIIS
uniref:Uncharacterized protein n=1 Tax=Anguilla anguilla TaxID=7936 RepID=A0A0E9XWV3_ANGAN